MPLLPMRRLGLFLVLVGLSMLGGFTFARLAYDASTGLPGLVAGLVISSLWFAFHFNSEPRLRRLPFGMALVVRFVCYALIIKLGLTANALLFDPYGQLTGTVTFNIDRWIDYWRGSNWQLDIAFSFAFGLILTGIITVRQLLGPHTFSSLLLGRYHKPREETRLIMFLDLIGSTTLAEHLGDHRFYALLQRLVQQISPLIDEERGIIDRYIGDAIVTTWPLRPGRPAAALRLVQRIDHLLAQHGDYYAKRYGCRPRFRAGMHAGQLIVGEIGVSRREIVFLGETVNIAARVEEEAKRRGQALLFTTEALRHLQLPPDGRIEHVAVFTPRGSSVPMGLLTLTEPAQEPVQEEQSTANQGRKDLPSLAATVAPPLDARHGSAQSVEP